MDARTVLEIFGWVGSILVVLSLMLPNQIKFRFWNFVGSFIATTYNILLGIWPFAMMNGAIVLIDLYWLYRLKKEAKDSRATIEALTDEALAGSVPTTGTPHDTAQ
ncbi:MAG: YgjV family protein [Flaviflexus sp.]|nr:YgjV family protein [Flaviflexus sp.]